MVTGTVKWVSQVRGYGFITPDDNDQEIMFHHSSTEEGQFRDMTEGDRVEYEVFQGQKGPSAQKVRRLNR